MISVGALAFGYLFLNVFAKSANLTGDVCSTLFGSTAILTLSKTDVWLCVLMSIVVIAIFTVFYNRIFAVTFDETFAQATGMKTNRYNLLIAVVTASVIVMAMKLVGSLLISALIIFPALSAMRMFKSFRAVILASAAVSVLCSSAGILLSILASTPVGATIVCMDIVVFFICSIIGYMMERI
jgi:zinc transport system permease protein